MSPGEISVDSLFIICCISNGVPPEGDSLHLGAKVEEADGVEGLDVVAATEIFGSDFRSLGINSLLHVEDLELGEVREVGDIVDAVAGGIQL